MWYFLDSKPSSDPSCLIKLYWGSKSCLTSFFAGHSRLHGSPWVEPSLLETLWEATSHFLSKFQSWLMLLRKMISNMKTIFDWEVSKNCNKSAHINPQIKHLKKSMRILTSIFGLCSSLYYISSSSLHLNLPKKWSATDIQQIIYTTNFFISEFLSPRRGGMGDSN